MKAVKLGDTRNWEPEVKSRINEFMLEQYEELGDDEASKYFNTHPEFRKLLHTARKGKLYAKDAIAFLNKKTPEKMVEMGIREKLAKFKDVVKGENQIVYDFVDFLSTYVNDQLVPSGFNMGAALALYDIQSKKNGYTGEPITHPIAKYPLDELNVLQLKIPEIAKAIFDEDFSKTVGKIHTRVQEIVKQKKEINNILGFMGGVGFERKESEGVESNVEMSDEKLVDVIHKIRKLINDLSEKNGNRTDDRIREGVNPYYNQTEQGLFMEMSYGSPHDLWTPRGKVQIPRVSWSSDREKIKEEFFLKMELEEYIEQTNGEIGSYGPVYKIKKFDGVDLPEPKERPRKEYISYEDAKGKWEEMNKK